MYLDGRTQGKPWHAPPVDTNKPAMEKVWTRVKSTGSWANCTSADRMRLRRVPKWLREWHDPVAPLGPFPRVGWQVVRRSPPQGFPF